MEEFAQVIGTGVAGHSEGRVGWRASALRSSIGLLSPEDTATLPWKKSPSALWGQVLLLVWGLGEVSEKYYQEETQI